MHVVVIQSCSTPYNDTGGQRSLIYSLSNMSSVKVTTINRYIQFNSADNYVCKNLLYSATCPNKTKLK